MNRGIWLVVPLLLVTACGAHHDARPAPISTSPTTAPAAVTAVAPTYGYQVLKSGPDVVTRSTGALLVDSPSDANHEYGDHEAVLVFRQPVPGRCLVSARLDLPIDAGSVLTDQFTWVYPSAIFKTLHGPPTVPDNGEDLLADDPSDKGVDTDGTDTFDVTDLYRAWQVGGPFPGSKTQFPLGAPLIVTVRSYLGGSAEFTLSTQLRDIRLRLAATPGCR